VDVICGSAVPSPHRDPFQLYRQRFSVCLNNLALGHKPATVFHKPPLDFPEATTLLHPTIHLANVSKYLDFKDRLRLHPNSFIFNYLPVKG